MAALVAAQMPPLIALLAWCTFGATFVVKGKAYVLSVLRPIAATLWNGKASLVLLPLAFALSALLALIRRLSLRTLFCIRY